MERPTVGIDLGASYTKVAYRSPLKRYGQNKFAEMKTEVALIDGSAMIPSLMIRTGDQRRPWITGADAAGTNPDGKMELFENWKSALYSSEFDAHKVRLVMVAGHFFGWLSDRLNGCGVDFGDNCRVRVTIPGLKRIEDRKDALIECMRLNGWPNHIEVVIEPVANLVGFLSGGRNLVTALGKMNYWLTIGDADGTVQHEFRYVFDEMRKFALRNRTGRNMTISVVDLGSFTLDVAKMTLDLKVSEYEQFPVDEIFEESWEIGIIDDLDKPCLSNIFSSYGIDGGRLSFVVRELAKIELYAGREFAVPGTRAVLGRSESDKEIVNSTI